MSRFLSAILLVWVVVGPPVVAAATPEEVAGQLLAERLFDARPDEESRITGLLIIRAHDVHQEIPIVCEVSFTATNWETSYQTTGTNQAGAERLVVIHSTNAPNQYLYARAAGPSAPLPALAPVPPAEAAVPLAGSDFSLADLGLDFLHWPGQRQLKGEMRLGQPCYVLESTRPGANGIVRIRSDIDKESGGLLIADGYDAQSHLIKEFSLHSSSFKKVNGHWRLQKMEIHNRKTHSQTELKFDLNK